VVPADSPIRTPADLAGRSIAVMPFSWHPEFVAAAPESAGTDWQDVAVVELNEYTAREALLRGGVDAWVVIEPTLGVLEAARPVRVVALTCGSCCSVSSRAKPVDHD
jgi:ABC-type nitrate/sulfonate/bicarbonate transport system substrate-binding protein